MVTHAAETQTALSAANAEVARLNGVVTHQAQQLQSAASGHSTLVTKLRGMVSDRDDQLLSLLDDAEVAVKEFHATNSDQARQLGDVKWELDIALVDIKLWKGLWRGAHWEMSGLQKDISSLQDSMWYLQQDLDLHHHVWDLQVSQ